MFVSIMFFAILMLAGQDDLSGSGGPGIAGIFMVLAVAAFIGGLVTQAAAPVKMIMHASLGMPIAIVAMLIISIVAGTANGSAFIGVIVIGLGGWGVSAIGAHAGWALVKDKKGTGGQNYDQVFG
jgi:hypothetical protein